MAQACPKPSDRCRSGAVSRVSDQTSTHAHTPPVWPNVTEAPHALLGDNSDALYSVNLPTRLNDDPRDFLVVVGVQHETTGKATFMSVAVYNTPRLMGIAAVTGDELLNSADRYLPT